jgi:Holliday junction resolvase
MVNKSKQKGTRWESDLVKLLEEHIKGATVKRIAGSGAIGTSLNEPLLCGDLIAKFPGIPKTFRIEAKVGYGGNKQMTFFKEWLDKIKEEADRTYSYPVVACKFLGARETDGVKYFLALDFLTFCDIMNYIIKLEKELNKDG